MHSLNARVGFFLAQGYPDPTLTYPDPRFEAASQKKAPAVPGPLGGRGSSDQNDMSNDTSPFTPTW